MGKEIFTIFLPLAGTTLGALLVFFLRRGTFSKLKEVMDGMAAGVMIAASVWSLLLPAIESGMKKGKLAGTLDAVAGLWLGFLFMMVLGYVLQVLEHKKSKPQGSVNCGSKLLMISVTLHNLPEGMAVGILMAAFHAGALRFPEVLAATVGIAIQNIPEGAIISVPLYAQGMNKVRAFFWGFLSGLVELLGAVTALFLTELVSVGHPFLLSTTAGMMIFVSARELIPLAVRRESSVAGIGSFGLGFGIMMALDILFS